MKSFHNKLFRFFSWAFVLLSLTACKSIAPVGDKAEPIAIVEETSEVLVPATATPTSTPEPPTQTPLPTITPTPIPTVEFRTEIVSFTTEDEIDLSGTLFLSEGDTAVVFAHMAGDNDQKNWIPFAKYIAPRGFTGLTFDFRCYGESGCGGSGSSSVLLSRDIGAAIDFLHGQGFKQVVCMGASMGGRGCVTVGYDRELAGLVILAGTGSSDPDQQNMENFISPDMPKLFIVSENDSTFDRTLAMTRLFESAPEPKSFKIYPGSAHGTELFDSSYNRNLRNLILNFLIGIR